MATTDSEYQKLLATKKVGKRGRTPLAPEEKARRQAAQRERNRVRNEARRRALLVLQHRYEGEYSALLEAEFAALTNKG
jgi:hypothetical protein